MKAMDELSDAELAQVVQEAVRTDDVFLAIGAMAEMTDGREARLLQEALVGQVEITPEQRAAIWELARRMRGGAGQGDGER